MCDYESIFLSGCRDDMNLCSPIDPQCVCCKSTEGSFVPLSSCLHSSLISDFFKLEIKLAELLLCSYCHAFLKKVDAFKKILELNLHLLNTTAPEVKHNRFSSLTFTEITFLSIVDYDNQIDNYVGDQEDAISDSGDRSDTIQKTEFDSDFVNEDVKISEAEIIDILSDIKPEPSTSYTDHSYCTINIPNKDEDEGVLNCDKKSETFDQISNKTILSVNSITPGKHIQDHNPSRLIPNPNNSLKLTPFAKISLPSTVPPQSLSNLDIETKQTTTKDLALVNDENDKQINVEKKYPPTKLYEGIYEIVLTMEELMKERAEARSKQSYLILPFKCETCIVSYTFEEMLKDHNRLKHSPIQGGFTCEVCKSVYKNLNLYKIHNKHHFLRYKCEPCGRINCALKTTVNHHNRAHGPVDAAARCYCKRCDFSCRSKREMLQHKRTHMKKISCTVCEAQFYTNGNLRQHMLNIHKESSTKYQCQKCPKVFNKIASLRCHMTNKHSKEESVFRCDQCNTFYNSEATLKCHLKTSNAHLTLDQKKFICDYCDKRFPAKPKLKEHILFIHLKSEENKCKICGKSYLNARVLKRHVKLVHEKVRRPRNKICQYCGKAFNDTNTLVCHIRTHTGERPLKCQHCPADFAHKAALYTHNKLVHGVKKNKTTNETSSKAKTTKTEQRNLNKGKRKVACKKSNRIKKK